MDYKRSYYVRNDTTFRIPNNLLRLSSITSKLLRKCPLRIRELGVRDAYSLFGDDSDLILWHS